MPNTKANQTGFKLAVALLLGLGWVLGASLPAEAQTETDPETLQWGAQIYAENCAVCHGAQGEGRVGATLAKDWPSIRPELATKDTISNGVAGSVMPAWAEARGGPLSEAEIDAVVLYILSWQTGGIPDLAPMPSTTPRPLISPVPEVVGDPNQGAVLYDQNCAVCHGANGEGRVGATLAKGWSSIRPDLAIKTTIVNGVRGAAMPAWSQANGGPLTEAQIDDIVAFVLSWQTNPVQRETQPAVAETPLSWLSGGGGVALFLVLFIILLAAIWFAQGARKQA